LGWAKEPERDAIASKGREDYPILGCIAMKFIKNPLSARMASFVGLLFIPLVSVGIWQGNAALQLPAGAGFAQEGLSPVSPDESVEETLNYRFSLADSLDYLKQIRGALSSFSQLTQESRPVLGEEAIAEVGYTDGETQGLGFLNWTGAVEGTLRHQDYQIQRLELELARKRYEDGEISLGQLEEEQEAYRRAQQEFEQFWGTFRVVD
jgi:hypothetical protein